MKISMKKLIVMLALLSQVAVTQAINVDFSTLPNGSVDLLAGPATLGDLMIQYQGGSVGVANAAGIQGDTLGILEFDFAKEVNQLNFDFFVFPLAETTPNDGVFFELKFMNSGVQVDSGYVSVTVFDVVNQMAGGAFAYTGGAFDQALMIFVTPAPYFAVRNMSYEESTGTGSSVPEAGSTLALLALGLTGIGGGRFCLRKR